MDSDNILVFFGKSTIDVQNNLTFHELKIKILHEQKKFIKYFTYKNEKINENLFFNNYPKFQTILDNNDFVEYRKGQFRCKKCRKYINITLWKCNHKNTCRAYHLLSKRDKTTLILESGYQEIDNSKNIEANKESDDSKNVEEEEEQEYNFDDEIDKILDKKLENYRIKMLNKINSLLYNK